MFDQYTSALLPTIREFDEMTTDVIARSLSSAYLSIVLRRLNGKSPKQEDVSDSLGYLRRLANTLEFHTILSEDTPGKERKAAAFVAAEAISLAIEIEQPSVICDKEGESISFDSIRFLRIESALLYFLSEFDACAIGVISQERSALHEAISLREKAASWCADQIERLCTLKLNSANGAPRFDFNKSAQLSPAELIEDTSAQLFVELGIAVSNFADWLSGDPNGYQHAMRKLDSIVAVLSRSLDLPTAMSLGSDFSLIYHLASIMLFCFPAMGERALIHIVPPPSDLDNDIYSKYLYSRARGFEKENSRPLVWPSAKEYVNKCIRGDIRHAVVSMPTGSGKSFVGELAISQSISNGWALYLAPTNALTQQIRRDLGVAFSALETKVFAFLGDHEYSTFKTETLAEMPTNSVAVMTPEKCALALRLYPEAFANCKIVVFDECQLIGDTGSARGPVSELVITELMLRAPTARFLLMSAIVQNPDELANWLGEATGQSSAALNIKWRPTRTLRAVLGLDNRSIQKGAKSAKSNLKNKSTRIKRKSFKSKCALAANLKGAWQSEERNDYAVAPINCEAPLKLIRRIRGNKWKYFWDGDSWVNSCATTLAASLAQVGIQTLVFTPANKHYPFSNAKKLVMSDSHNGDPSEKSSILHAYRILAEFELGCKSEVFRLLDEGVAVHTSLMLETEKMASEIMFRSRLVTIMFATGTLAQGLNLPAIAVIIAGSKIGDTRGQHHEDIQRRKFSQLLNAAGRAGRAGFANQGVVIAIPDKPVAFHGIESFTEARQQVDYLQQSDDSVSIESGLSDFLDAVCQNGFDTGNTSDTDLQILSLLAGGDDNQIGPMPILEKSFAAYIRRKRGQPELTQKAADSLIGMGESFIEQMDAPEWITIAAQRAGIDYFLTLAISQAWATIRPELPADVDNWTLIQWRDELLNAIVHVPPGLLSNHLPIRKLKHICQYFKEIEHNQPAFLNIRATNWTPPQEWLDAWSKVPPPLHSWMTGDSLSKIATLLFGKSTEELSFERTSGKPLPKTLAIVNDAWGGLSILAGGFVAIAEQIFEGELPLNLACLPMAIRYGSEDPSNLAWFRFGIRLRLPARQLANKFPVPNLGTDEELMQWVRQKRRDWLASNDKDENEILSAIRAFITA